MKSLTKKERFVEGVIDKYGLEPGEVDEDNEVDSGSEMTTGSEKNAQFVKAMIVMKKVTEDGYPGVIQVADHDFLCIGSVGAAYNLHALLDLNVTHILCMSCLCKLKFSERFVYKKVACRDTLDQNIFDVLEECFGFINDFRTTAHENSVVLKKNRILIHCYQGVSRSTAVCAAYMIKYFGYSLDDALDCIRQCRPQASPNYNFMKSLRELETQSNPDGSEHVK